jgi:hypothetical protein
MFDQAAGRKAHRTFAAASEIETGRSQIHDPKQGARLVRAFLRITDPALRLAIDARRLEDAQVVSMSDDAEPDYLILRPITVAPHPAAFVA